ncbi:hypothetical protein FAGAP_6696 [Fusarium agapanthi]|uniref:Uncharacterized protein n=1 Tax=Fusarium agapanthi TaxID=1803897 RepID=A0A9P5B9R8_9HYPO|nr:hypothetical protein FAGAP_6696 [Fusarium agapanthi]
MSVFFPEPIEEGIDAGGFCDFANATIVYSVAFGVNGFDHVGKSPDGSIEPLFRSPSHDNLVGTSYTKVPRNGVGDASSGSSD